VKGLPWDRFSGRTEFTTSWHLEVLSREPLCMESLKKALQKDRGLFHYIQKAFNKDSLIFALRFFIKGTFLFSMSLQ